MGRAIPHQHPAVVLRSHYNYLRALLAVAMIAVAGLTAAVVIIATHDEADNSRSATSRSADAPRSQPRPTQVQAFPGLARQAEQAQANDGGSEDGTRRPTPFGGPRP